MKRCVHCDQPNPVDAFPTNRRTRDGLSSWCKSCHNAATRAWRHRKTGGREARATAGDTRTPRPIAAR
jgi:hypothetical protein